ncbi:MAG: DNA-processing protein DprA [Solobacterium sp.]|nr:DNA-processing protein DprA [Solobacterium sp.]
MEYREKLANLSYSFSGNWHQIRNALQKNEAVHDHRIREPYITIADKDYPESLRELRYPPFVLFYRGRKELLKERCVTVVGSRELCAYGERMTRLSADYLKENYVLVSGLAKGADSLVHSCALQGGRTIGVIGSGLATVYPRSSAHLYARMQEEGLILSEYPAYVPVRRHHFPWRNRILAALGEFIVVTQAGCKSGTMLTVNEALELGRDVFAFPYPFDADEGLGCNQLIAEGAMIMYDIEQLRTTGSMIRR